MAITVTGSYFASIETQNHNTTLPTYAAGDVGVVFCGAGSQFETLSITGATGWTSLRSDVLSGASVAAVFYKVLGSSETSPTVSVSGTQWVDVSMVVFRGVDNTTPIDATTTYAELGGTAPNHPDITTVTANAGLALYTYNANQGSTGYTVPTGFTLDPQADEGYSMSAWQLDSGAAGAQTIGTWNLPSNSNTRQFYTVALRPAGGGPTGQTMAIGSTEIGAVYVGSTEITRIYIGSTLTFEKP